MSEQISSDEVAVEEVITTPQPSVGEQLGAARQARGLAVLDIAQALKLGARQVEALENGDWQALPGQTFIRGFVRNYARMVQIDSAPLMAQLDGVLEKPVNGLAVPETRPTSMPVTGGSASRRDRVVVMTGVGLVALAAVAYFLMPNDLSALRESTQGLLDSLARKDAPVPVSPVASPSDPVFPPGSPQSPRLSPPRAAWPPMLGRRKAPPPMRRKCALYSTRSPGWKSAIATIS
jgi:cytoskeleton protein RodZ